MGILDESLGLLFDIFPLVLVFSSINLGAWGKVYFSNVSGDSSYSGLSFLQAILSVASWNIVQSWSILDLRLLSDSIAIRYYLIAYVNSNAALVTCSSWVILRNVN